MLSVLQGMAEELSKLLSTIKDPEESASFEKQMKNFMKLFNKYLYDTAMGSTICWENISSPNPSQIVSYSLLHKCPEQQKKELLGKLAVVKLNGGLGTTMGCNGPKSAIEVREGLTFLDLTVLQVEHLNRELDTDVPLILMNSFNTKSETERIVRKYKKHRVDIRMFTQSRYPRIFKESLMPCAKCTGQTSDWYPPGHGDIFESLENSNLLTELIDAGKEWIFVSNIDNLGATIDTAILKHLDETKAEFVMEVTDKTKSDVKGGTIIDYNGGVRLLEIAQVSSDHVDDFKSIKKFKIFNTNNLWISLKAIKRLLKEQKLDLEIIPNGKTLETGEKVIQLETAVGAAIKHFAGAHGINVPRSRFLPVKSTSDLFLITSDIYKLDKGQLVMSPARLFPVSPIVKLGDHFKKVQAYQSRFKGPPKILELDHLTVTGDVTFGYNVTLKGTVIIVANHGNRIDIPSGAVLEDKVVTGNLRIMDH